MSSFILMMTLLFMSVMLSLQVDSLLHDLLLDCIYHFSCPGFDKMKKCWNAFIKSLCVDPPMRVRSFLSGEDLIFFLLF